MNLYNNLIDRFNKIKSWKNNQIPKRIKDILYEELYDDTPYILWYYDKKEIEERQKKEYERYIKSKNRNHF